MSEGDWALVQVGQRVAQASHLGDSRKPPGCSRKQLTQGDPTWAEQLD